jgi:hypothetical protein
LAKCRRAYDAARLYQGIPVDKVNMIEQPVMALSDAIKSKDSLRFTAFADLTSVCNSCHPAAQVGFEVDRLLSLVEAQLVIAARPIRFRLLEFGDGDYAWIRFLDHVNDRGSDNRRNWRLHWSRFFPRNLFCPGALSLRHTRL